MKTFAEFDFTPNPDQIRDIYDSGFVGAVPEDRISQAFNRSPQPRFYDAFPEARGLSRELEVCLPIRACQALIDPDFCADRKESQRQGDCVGKMIKNQGMVDGCVDAMFGETEWKKGPDGKGVQYADENIYGERGHSGEGANCWRLWNTVAPDGSQGFLFRDTYQTSQGTFDLSKYRADLSGPWGRRGTPEALSEIARKNPALRVYRAKSLEEVMDALAMGFGVGRCGSDGYESTRNQDGFSDTQGTWYHAIAVGGFDRSQRILDKYGGPGFLHYHCWGGWNRGPKSHEQPDGSWWVRSRFLERWVRSGEVAVVASVVGHNRKLIWEQKMDRRSFLIKEGIFKCVSSR